MVSPGQAGDFGVPLATTTDCTLRGDGCLIAVPPERPSHDAKGDGDAQHTGPTLVAMSNARLVSVSGIKGPESTTDWRAAQNGCPNGCPMDATSPLSWPQLSPLPLPDGKLQEKDQKKSAHHPSTATSPGPAGPSASGL